MSLFWPVEDTNPFLQGQRRESSSTSSDYDSSPSDAVRSEPSPEEEGPTAPEGISVAEDVLDPHELSNLSTVSLSPSISIRDIRTPQLTLPNLRTSTIALDLETSCSFLVTVTS